ncbi:MAG: RloB domain-containing protein [Oscillospiraceae bacterium]|nr:RloB domain-containing protein [Oscillospiraceae bacterium]
MSKSGRSFSSKKRNRQNRKEKPMIIITAEGRNETEAKYFDGFRTPDCPYIIKFHKAGHLTDPTKLAESIRKRWDAEDADVRTGDMAFVIVDLDNKESKAKEIQQLEAKNRIEKFIVSNPSFEVWYLLHYEYSTRSYMDADAVIRELKKHHTGYEKTYDMYPLLVDKMGDAITNAEKLEKYYKVEEHPHPDVSCNPYTDVHRLVKMIRG